MNDQHSIEPELVGSFDGFRPPSIDISHRKRSVRRVDTTEEAFDEQAMHEQVADFERMLSQEMDDWFD